MAQLVSKSLRLNQNVAGNFSKLAQKNNMKHNELLAHLIKSYEEFQAWKEFQNDMKKMATDEAYLVESVQWANTVLD